MNILTTLNVTAHICLGVCLKKAAGLAKQGRMQTCAIVTRAAVIGRPNPTDDVDALK